METTDKLLYYRTGYLNSVKRLVVKVGSGVITGESGLNLDVIDSIASDICWLWDRDIEVLLVSSGAIAAGMKKLGFSKRPSLLSQQQAVAAVGQGDLMMSYEKAFASFGKKVAQILLTKEDISHRQRYLNARNTIFTLLSWGIQPIINENDTVAVDEIRFGDNDNLGAMVTKLTESDLFINLTNIDGLFDKDPRLHKDARAIRIVENVTKAMLRSASEIPGSLGTGGMLSKVKAAHQLAISGIPTIIANGLKKGIIRMIFSGKDIGTLFIPQEVSLSCKRHWIAFVKSPKGKLVIDRGAERAIMQNGKSLLPAGVREVRGRFSRGDAVTIINENEKELGIGIVNYHSGDIKRIKGLKTSDIERVLGFKYADEVIHRDNMVLKYQIEEGEGICQIQELKI
ncbi:MAG: glutamate 5-kinase [Deltaproteobacteria bacterium]|nr:MAG: glutamate 5-kinase [Deltaproteobacteria bacterium]